MHEGLIEPSVALARLADLDRADMAVRRFADARPAVGHGVGAAAGVACGRAAFDSAAAKRLAAQGDPVILVRHEPVTEDIEGLAVAEGLLTAVGGRTAHAAVVARQMGKVCVVGCTGLSVAGGGTSMRLGGHVLQEGDWIALDGDTGDVTAGRRAIVRLEPAAELAELDRWAVAAAPASACRTGG